MRFTYPAQLQRTGADEIVVSFRDLPECLTDGADETEALAEAACKPPRLVGRGLAVLADHDPLVGRLPAAVAGAIVDDEGLGATGTDAHAEAGQLVVPSDPGLVGRLERIDDPLGERGAQLGRPFSGSRGHGIRSVVGRRSRPNVRAAYSAIRHGPASADARPECKGAAGNCASPTWGRIGKICAGFRYSSAWNSFGRRLARLSQCLRGPLANTPRQRIKMPGTADSMPAAHVAAAMHWPKLHA